jgi:hypothetical protein
MKGNNQMSGCFFTISKSFSTKIFNYVAAGIFNSGISVQLQEKWLR